MAVAAAQHVERGKGTEQPAPAAAARHAVAHRLQRVVHRQRLRVLHEHARLAAGARAFPHHVAAQPRLARARGVAQEIAQLMKPQFGVGHPVVKARHQFAPRDRRHARQDRSTWACALAHAFAVKRRAARGLEQPHQALLLALRDQEGRRVGGGHHVEHGGLQVQGVENGGDGAHRARAPGCAARGGAWPPQCSNMLVSIVIGVLLTRLRPDTA